jgi:hypothetical protein
MRRAASISRTGWGWGEDSDQPRTEATRWPWRPGPRRGEWDVDPSARGRALGDEPAIRYAKTADAPDPPVGRIGGVGCRRARARVSGADG